VSKYPGITSVNAKQTIKRLIMPQNDKFAFVIPAYNPDEHLISVINSIEAESDNIIFVIDDGSKENTQYIFQKIENEYDSKRVIVLKHAINLGKGAALKTVFNHILVEYPDIEGVVTLDSDGQHSTADCLRILEVLDKDKGSFVLGYRTFSKDIPLKSYIGNNISKFIYKIILGRNFKDTQTGLRGVSRDFMKICLTINSNRFEFETEQLAMAVNQHIKIVEIPIETIYIKNNKASSFRPLVDSFRIYFVLFRYGLSSIITAVVDFMVFVISLSLGADIFIANMLARTVSIGVQFTLLDKFVFYTKAKIINFILFALYVYAMGIVSSLAQISAVESMHMPVLAAKIIVEGILLF